MKWFSVPFAGRPAAPRPVHVVPAGRPHAAVISAMQALCFDDRWPVQDIMDILSGLGAIGFIAVPDASPNAAAAPDRALQAAWRSLTGSVRPEPVGFILARAISGEAEILSLGVLPEARRTGAGARLVAAACREARTLGADRIYLEVAEDNAAGLGLYRRLAFDKVGRRPAYYKRADGTRVAALVMRKHLAESDTGTV